MAKTKLTIKEIVGFIKKEGGREITEEDKKTEWYKVASKKPSCFKTKTPRKSSIKA